MSEQNEQKEDDLRDLAHEYVVSVLDNADVWTQEWAENIFIAGYRAASKWACPECGLLNYPEAEKCRDAMCDGKRIKHRSG